MSHEVFNPRLNTQDTPANDINVFPNPSKAGQTLSLTSNNQSIEQVVLLDVAGRSYNLSINKTSPQEIQLGLSSQLNPGIYLLRLTLEDGSSLIKKLAVQ